MKKAFAAILLLTLALCFSAYALEAGEAGIFMINVGKGDAILVFWNEKTFLIDTGKTEAYGRLQAALLDNGISKIDAVFITHGDADHVGGLSLLLDAGFEIERFYASGCSIEYTEEEHPAYLAAGRAGKPLTWLYAGDTAEDAFEVLAPEYLFTDKEDNNSLVMMFSCQYGRVLLSGDMEYPQEDVLLRSEANLACDVLKVANHADDDTLSQRLLDRAKPSIALISTSSYEKPDTPDPELLKRLESIGCQTLITQNSEAGIRVSLDKNGIRAEYEGYRHAPEIPDGLRIARVEAKEDRVVLESDRRIDLGGWLLYSDKGDEMMVFERGTVMEGTLIVGSKDTTEPYDVLWNDKNVIHNKKEDVIYLADPYGRTVAALSNGK